MENGYLEETLERLAAATVQLERTIAGMEERHASVCGEVQRIVATADTSSDAMRLELERRLAEAQQTIVQLQADGMTNQSSRRTLAAAAAGPLLTKSGVQTGGGIEAGALDAAMSGLSLEQRIAVKSQLLRAGAKCEISAAVR